MSGQPVKTQADINKKRNEYMETLALQENINDMNLTANKNYLLTGSLPPQSQMQDTRTTSEKLKDFEAMKRKIADDFKGLMDSSTAYSVVNKLIESPLNVDNTLLRFLAQRAPSIMEQLKRQYSYGIEGDANDVLKIVEMIKNMYSEMQGKFQTTKSYMNNISSTSSSSRIISANDIDSVIASLEDVIKNIEILTQRGVNKGGLPNTRNVLLNLRNNIKDLKNDLMTSNQLNLFMQEIGHSNINPDYSRYDLEGVFTLLESLPKYTEVMALINKINQHIRSDNLETASDGVRRLGNMFSMLDKRENRNLLRRLRDIKFVQLEKEHDIMSKQAEQTLRYIKSQNEDDLNASKAQKVYIVNSQDKPVWVRNYLDVKPSSEAQPSSGVQPSSFNMLKEMEQHIGLNLPEQSEEEYEEPLELSERQKRHMAIEERRIEKEQKRLNPSESSIKRRLKKEEKQKRKSEEARETYEMGHEDINIPSQRDIENKLMGLEDLNVKTYPKTTRRIVRIPKSDIELKHMEVVKNVIHSLPPDVVGDIIEYLVNEAYIREIPSNITYNNLMTLLERTFNEAYIDGDDLLDKYDLYKYANISGFGIKKRRGRPRGSGIVKVKRTPMPSYVKFGINQINQKTLGKGIMNFRRGPNSYYKDLPAKHISSNLQNIFKTIIGGGVPKYDELSKLDKEEQEYLYKIISRSEMEDKLSVPAPSKDSQEKDIHNFEVMRGQILSGNDNVELVKKFKLLMRKLARQGLLPKNDVDEMIEILTDLNY